MCERSDAKVLRKTSAGMTLTFLNRVEAARLALAGIAFLNKVGAARLALAGIAFLNRVEAGG